METFYLSKPGHAFFNLILALSHIPGVEGMATVLIWYSYSSDSLNSRILSLLSGACDQAFAEEFGFRHYIVYGFEEQDNVPAWTPWDGSGPIPTTEKAFCGRQSLHVRSMCMGRHC